MTEKVVPAAPALPKAPAAPPSVGLVQPVVNQVSAVADDLVTSVPVVNQVVPADTVSGVTAPVARIADGTTTAVVETIVPPVAETLPVLEPVLQPVADVVTGSAPLPVDVPELPQITDPEVPGSVLPAVPVEDGSADATAAGDAGTGPAAVIPHAPEPAPSGTLETTPAAAGQAALAGTSCFPAAVHDLPSLGTDQPHTADPAFPAQAPAAPGSGTGSSGTSGSSPGSAAWLTAFNLDHAITGDVLAGGDSVNAPAPVSFDPGSSPD
ncbi:hypothetical protein AB0P28_15145 [Pseudarthrobacter sp. NPDC089323]